MPRRARRVTVTVTVTLTLTTAALAVAGCSTLIGLEDRNLRADGGGVGAEGGTGGDEGAAEGGDLDGGGEGDAGDDGSLTGRGDMPCTPFGSAVLEFTAADESWRYDVSPAPANDGFVFIGVPFHLLRSSEPQLPQAKRQLYVKRPMGVVLGDYFATLTQNELSMTHETVAAMFAVYEITPPSPQPPGTVEVKVIAREAAPLRHKLLVGNGAPVPLGWKHDNRTFYVCP